MEVVDHLDAPLFYAGRLEEPLLRLGPAEDDRAALLFSSLEGAGALGGRLPHYELSLFSAADWRAKEELFKALLAQGVEVYLLDESEPHSVRVALAYVQSHKTQTACL
ncbi:hypothetical protein [Calidithermus chliarophilus]|uniref:hypothetical protein n=1 Tax=Calidithermus chliarophilus TaxID=52023 RepID=UPI0004060E24|nr:hypothetical protein [Calidithermus chliarophilus]